MPKLKVFINNFTTGEISPQVQARVDLAKYEGACRRILNGIVMAQGGVTKRPGTRLVAEASDGLLIPFAYSDTQTYALLFTDRMVHFYSDGATVLDGNTPYTLDSPYALEDLPLLKFVQSADVMYLAHPKHPPRTLSRYDHTVWEFKELEFTAGIEPPSDVEVTETGFTDNTGTYLGTEIEYKVSSVSVDGEESLPSKAVPADTLSTWPQGARVSLQWTAVPGAARYEVYKNAHGWFEWAGSTEKPWFTDDNIEPDSTVSPKEYRDPFHAPAMPTASGDGGTTYQIRVSSVNSAGAESPACGMFTTGTTVTINAVDDAELYFVYYRSNPTARWKYIVASSPDTKDTIDVNGGSGDTKVATYEHVDDPPAEGIGYYAWKLKSSFSGSHSKNAYTRINEGYPSSSNRPTLYWIRWKREGVIDKIVAMSEQIIAFHSGTAIVATFPANGVEGTPPETADCYPGAVGIYQQRLMFGGTERRPQTVWLSETGSFNSMAVTKPLRDDSAITATVDTRQRNEVRHFIALSDAFVMTNATEFRMQGKDGAITPGTISFRPQSYWGSSHVPPLVIGTTILMVDASGRVVRDVHYNLQEDGYSGDDRSILATHLLRKGIVDWAYQQNPFSTVYAVREDGKLLTFTYLREQEVWAWAQHESAGDKFRSVCCVREDGKDRVYFLVNRGDAYFVEEQALRDYGDDPMDAVYLDCAITGTTGSAIGSAEIGGLQHLEGREVVALVDGCAVTGMTVTNGAVSLPMPAAHEVTVGLPYIMEIETVEPGISGQDGSRFGSRKTIGPVVADVLETAEIQIGSDAVHLEQIKVPVKWGPPVELYTGLLKAPTPGFARDRATILIRSEKPLPATVLAVRVEVSVE